MFTSIFSGIARFFGFGGDDAEINVNKSTDLNVSNEGVITPSPAVAAAARVEGRIDINFNNKPEEFKVSKPIQNGDDGLILSTSGI